MDTSKTRSIKYLLLQAWRERWSDVVWGISIKSVLPRGVSGDVYDLADCILQQALVGPGPNNLFMSYLMHCLSSRVVSYGAVLSSIGRYQGFYKPHCILSLLDLLKTFQSRIGCHGNEEECIALCKAVVSVTHWLYSCVYHSITKLSELKHSPEHISIMEKSYEALYYFSNSTFIKSLLYVGKFEDHGMYTQMLQRHRELEEKVNQVPGAANVSKEVIEGALSLVSSVDKLPMVPSFQESKNENCLALASTVNAMVIIGAILSPSSDTQAFINHLLLIKKLQNFKLSQLYCEIIRSCMIGTCDNTVVFEDNLKWMAFSLLKLPCLISKMNSIHGNEEEDAFEKCWDNLLEFSPLLNQMDMKMNCDYLESFVAEFQKANIQTEEQGRRLLARRRSHGFVGSMISQQALKLNMERGHVTVALVIRADHTLKSIITSLESDYSKNQEPLLNFLCQILPVRNFKLILGAFSALGTLRVFIEKLIDYNEYNIKHNNDIGSDIRAVMFDVTFILLLYLTQYYGIDVVVEHASRKKDSFFIRWITHCFSEGGKFKCPERALSGCKQSVIDSLLIEFLNTEQKMNTNAVRWDDVIINAPAAAKEILLAWEYGALSLERVKAILDHIKEQFCFLPLCISAWMCNYVNVLHHEEQLKPQNLILQFSQLANESQLPTETNKKFYNERAALAGGIIKIMMNELSPMKQLDAKVIPSIIPHCLKIKNSIGKIIKDVFQEVHYRGWLDLKSIRYFESLLGIGGPRWLCDHLVRQILGYKFLNDINRAVNISIGIFYLDIEQCALALLLHVLPFYLYSETHQDQLAEPYGTALARLAVITIYAALQSRQSSSISVVKVGYKRSHLEMDMDDRDHTEHSRPSKIHRSNAELLEDTPFELQSVGDEHLRNAVSNPINKAIADLMRMLLVIASDPSCSGRSYFPIRFLEQIVLCAKDQASAILQFMPLGLVGMLLKKYPEEFSHELILAVSSMLSPRARKVSALSLCQLTIAQNRLMCKSQQSFLGF